MNLPRYIARRTASDGQASQGMMLHIATVAVAVSIAVMVLSLAVMSGFRDSISQLMTSMVADVTLCDPASLRQPQSHPITDSKALRDMLTTTPNVASVEPIIAQSGILRTNSGALGFAMKGVATTEHLSLFEERLAEGEMLKIEEGRRKEILIPKAMASALNIKAGSRVELLFLEEEHPHREIFKVCGIYNSALGDIGANLILSDIRNLRKTNSWEEHEISAYNIRLHSTSNALLTSDLINFRLMHEYDGEDNLVAISSEEAHADIFSWLETHDVNAAVILTIMLVVAIFNMVTAILILVLDQTRMIGILKSLGMTSTALRKVFAYRALRILGYGLLWGNTVAVAVALAQKYLHIIKLDEAGYFLSEVPISLEWGMIGGVNILFIVVVMAVVYLSTAIVSRVEIADSIKYE